MLNLDPLPAALQSKSIPVDLVQPGASGRPPSLQVWNVLLRRWWQVLFLAIILGGPAGFELYHRFALNYKAEASVMVSPIMPRVMYMSEESRAAAGSAHYDEYLHTLSRLFLERRVLEPAIRKLAENQVDWQVPGAPGADPVEQLRARLNIDLVRNTSLIEVSVRDPRPTAAAAIVNEVVKSFLNQLSLEESLESDAKVQTLTQEQRAKQKELAALYVQLDKLTEKLGSAALDAHQNVYYDRTASLNEPLNKAYLDRLRAEADDVSAQKNIEMLTRPVPAEMIRKALDADPDFREMRAQLERETRETTVLISTYGSEHPMKIRGTEQLKNIEDRLDRMIKDKQDQIEKVLRHERMDEAERLASETKVKRDAASKVEESMRKMMDTAMTELAEFGKAQNEAGKLKIRIDRLTESLASVEKRIEQLQLEARAPGRVSLRNDAETQPEAVNKMGWLAAAAAALAGTAAAMALIVALDYVFPAMSNGRDLSKYGILALTPARLPKDKPEALAELAGRIALLSGKSLGVQILAPNGTGDSRGQGLIRALSQLGRNIVILDHDPKLGAELVREALGPFTCLRLNLAASCGFSRHIKDIAEQEKGAFFCALMPIATDPLLVKDLAQEMLEPVVLAAPTRASARALSALSSIARKVQLIGAVLG